MVLIHIGMFTGRIVFFSFHNLDNILSSRLSHKEYDSAKSITTVVYFLNILPIKYLALILML